MTKRLYTPPAITTIDMLPCQLMEGSVKDDPNNPNGAVVTFPDGEGTTTKDQGEFYSLDDPHLWY